MDALWPDADLSRGQERFWTALGNLRSTIRKLLPGEHQLIEKRGELYVVEPGVFDVDVWRFQRALALAQSNHGTGVEHLQMTVAYQGTEMLEGSYYEWAEPLREEMRHKCLDACVRLAQWFEGHGDKEGALETIERGIQLDPYAEHLYQEALRITNELDRPEAARRLFQRLADRLSQIDADPSEPSKTSRASVSPASESGMKTVEM